MIVVLEWSSRIGRSAVRIAGPHIRYIELSTSSSYQTLRSCRINLFFFFFSDANSKLSSVPPSSRVCMIHVLAVVDISVQLWRLVGFWKNWFFSQELYHRNCPIGQGFCDQNQAISGHLKFFLKCLQIKHQKCLFKLQTTAGPSVIECSGVSENV